jgi:hypothetical protein
MEDLETEVKFENEKGEYTTEINDDGIDEVYKDLEGDREFNEKDENQVWSKNDEEKFLKNVVPNLEMFVKHLGCHIKENGLAKYEIDSNCLGKQQIL